MDHEIRHLSTYSYDPHALSVALRLKLFPPSFDGQQVEEWTVSVNGETVPPLVTTGLGNIEGMWSLNEETDRIEIVAEGRVVTSDTTGIVRGLPSMGGLTAPPPGIYCRPTALTKPDKAIRALAEKLRNDADPLAALHALMAELYERIAYRTGSTAPETTAAQAFERGEGVCQDHAHIFIAAARAMGLPARYVTGYLQAEGGGNAANPAAQEAEDEQAPEQIQAQEQQQSQEQAQGPEPGEDDGQIQSQRAVPAPSQLLETHAWAEVHVDGIGWIGFDASADLCPTETYVRLCSGQDAFDASPIRGNVIGATSESLEVSVAIGHAQQ